MAKREDIKRKRNKSSKSNNLTVILIIAAFAIVAVGMVILTQIKAAPKVTTPQRTLATQRDGLNMGDPNAKVKVTEFADFQCPACASYWAQLEPTIIQNYIDTGKVYFTYNPFSFLGQGQAWDESSKAAEAAYCANEQDHFWEYRDLIFANHNGENQGVYTHDVLVAYAKELGLDTKAFTACFDSGKYTQKVVDDSNYAAGVGATYTPSFLIDGQVVNANELMPKIEELLSK